MHSRTGRYDFPNSDRRGRPIEEPRLAIRGQDEDAAQVIAVDDRDLAHGHDAHHFDRAPPLRRAPRCFERSRGECCAQRAGERHQHGEAARDPEAFEERQIPKHAGRRVRREITGHEHGGDDERCRGRCLAPVFAPAPKHEDPAGADKRDRGPEPAEVVAVLLPAVELHTWSDLRVRKLRRIPEGNTEHIGRHAVLLPRRPRVAKTRTMNERQSRHDPGRRVDAREQDDGNTHDHRPQRARDQERAQTEGAEQYGGERHHMHAAVQDQEGQQRAPEQQESRLARHGLPEAVDQQWKPKHRQKHGVARFDV